MRQKAESKYIHSIIADHINDPTGLEFLHKDSLEMPKALYSVLRVHISKYDYDKKAPRNEAEQFFWLRRFSSLPVAAKVRIPNQNLATGRKAEIFDGFIKRSK